MAQGLKSLELQGYKTFANRTVFEFSDNINIRISEEQREKWQKYIDAHPEFNSVSQFIRYCVDYIVDQGRIHEKIEEENERLKADIEDMRADIKSLQKTQKDILSTLSGIKK